MLPTRHGDANQSDLIAYGSDGDVYGCDFAPPARVKACENEVVGCGFMRLNDEQSYIFFTKNGVLLGMFGRQWTEFYLRKGLDWVEWLRELRNPKHEA